MHLDMVKPSILQYNKTVVQVCHVEAPVRKSIKCLINYRATNHAMVTSRPSEEEAGTRACVAWELKNSFLFYIY